MGKYIYIDANKLTNIVDINNISPSLIFNTFIEQDVDIVYVMDNEKIYGIISIGDLEKFLQGNSLKIKINQNFISLNRVDEHLASKLLERYIRIKEVPIVCDKKLIGVLSARQNSSDDEMKHRREYLKHLRWDKEERAKWYVNETKRFIHNCPARVFVYALPNETFIANNFNEEERNLYNKKVKYPTNKEGITSMSQEEKIDFWGAINYEIEEKKFLDSYKRLRIVQKNGVYSLEDICTDFFTFEDGYRLIDNVPQKTSKKIFFFGPCIVTGAYVKDNQTIEYYLQQLIIEKGYCSYEVVNCGLLGPEECLNRAFTEKISRDDIVIITDFWGKYLDNNILNMYYAGDLSDVYIEYPKHVKYIFNDLSHCNYSVNKSIAKKIVEDITPYLNNSVGTNPRKSLQEFYVPWKIHSYFEYYFTQNSIPKIKGNEIIGAIVMNCNPFTLGHMYLIEQASKMVDSLFVFVVQEDKSYFKFEDRINMVNLGVNQLKNVFVLPSGQYILSQETFKQYFEKDVVSNIEDMDYDLHIFGMFVASKLNIKVRFVGEELTDKVTAKYNDTMKKILPNYSVSVHEIPRKKNEDGLTISASIVRNMLKNKEYEKIMQFVPNSTYTYLQQMGLIQK